MEQINRMSHQTKSTANAAEAAAMVRALELATRGPMTGANPQVGCVLLDSTGVTLAEGWHEGSGTPHAEIVALDALKASGREATGVTAVVTLEPCAHTGKTGPCAQALIDAGVTRVVYAVSDPGQDSGGGAQTLHHAGIDVMGGLEEHAGHALIERWHTATGRGVPWVTLKWAMSWDGRAAANDGTSQWITGSGVREQVHLDRSAHDVIVVGTNTVLVDDPSLSARTPEGALAESQPMAVVIGEREIPVDAKVRSHPGGFLHHPSHDISALLRKLFAQGIRSVYVEGGPTLASAFVAGDLVDEFHITVGPLLLGGGHTALTDVGVDSMSSARHLNLTSVTRVEDDVIVIARPTKEGH